VEPSLVIVDILATDFRDDDFCLL